MCSTEYGYRVVRPSDFEEIKRIHLSLFPLQYSDDFLRKATEGVGLNGGELHSCIVTLRDDIIGFIFCQLIPRTQCEEKDILDERCPSTCACYILTLGLLPPYRRLGLGQQLLAKCLEYASTCGDCGMIYLHVIEYNLPGIYFYEKNGFFCAREVPGFYHIKGVDYTAYAYALFLNDGYPSFLLRVYGGLRKYTLNIARFLSSWVHTAFSSEAESHVHAEYMDDEIFSAIREDPDSIIKRNHQVDIDVI